MGTWRGWGGAKRGHKGRRGRRDRWGRRQIYGAQEDIGGKIRGHTGDIGTMANIEGTSSFGEHKGFKEGGLY